MSIADFSSWEREGSIDQAACEINENRLRQMLPMVKNIVFRTAYLSLYIIDIVQVGRIRTGSLRRMCASLSSRSSSFGAALRRNVSRIQMQIMM